MVAFVKVCRTLAIVIYARNSKDEHNEKDACDARAECMRVCAEDAKGVKIVAKQDAFLGVKVLQVDMSHKQVFISHEVHNAEVEIGVARHRMVVTPSRVGAAFHVVKAPHNLVNEVCGLPCGWVDVHRLQNS